MTDQQSKGGINDVKGKVDEAAGKMTGNEEQELHGKGKQVQGDAQRTLGKAKDAAQDKLGDAQNAVEGLKR